MRDFCVAVVDAFDAAAGFPAAFKAAGGRVIHVRSTSRLPYGSTMSDPSLFSEVLLFDGDLDALVRRLAAAQPVAVLAGKELGVELADALSEALGLPTNGTALSAARRDKYVQIERIKQCGVPGARQLRTGDEDELRRWHGKLAGSVVVKPLRSAGGDGVMFCDNPDESAAALKTLRGRHGLYGDPITEVVVQEYLVGDEYILNTVSCAGSHHVTDVWATQRLTANGVRDLCVAQVLMAPDEPAVAVLADYGRAVLDALGVRYGPAHLEIKLTPDGPRLVEAAARMSGLPYHVADVIGEGQLEWTVDAYGRPDRFHARAGTPYAPRHAFAWAALVSPVDGTLVEYRALHRIRALDSVRQVNVVVEPGAPIERTTYDLAYPVTLTLAHAVPSVLHRDLNTIRYLDGAGMYEVLARRQTPTVTRQTSDSTAKPVV